MNSKEMVDKQRDRTNTKGMREDNELEVSNLTDMEEQEMCMEQEQLLETKLGNNKTTGRITPTIISPLLDKELD
jgi:hypothetical protein